MSKMPKPDLDFLSPSNSATHELLKAHAKQLQALFQKHAASPLSELAVTGRSAEAVVNLIQQVIEFNGKQDAAIKLRDVCIERLEARLEKLESQQATDQPSAKPVTKKNGLSL
jgi:BMFP domain-containing protein YqiC